GLSEGRSLAPPRIERRHCGGRSEPPGLGGVNVGTVPVSAGGYDVDPPCSGVNVRTGARTRPISDVDPLRPWWATRIRGSGSSVRADARDPRRLRPVRAPRAVPRA